MESGRLCFHPSTASIPQGNLFSELGDNVIFPGGARRMMSMEESSKRRPFFSSPEEDQEYSFFDEDNISNYYDDQLMPDQKKRRLTPDQVHLLEKSFEAENKLEPERKTQLAKKLGLQPRQVAVWFQNRRARWKTRQLERDYDLLKASLDSLRSNYDSLLRDNQNLKSQVVSLTNKLEAKEMAWEAASGQKVDLFPGEPAVVGAVQPEVKVEDRLSAGSGGSAVFNEEDGRQLGDSGDSYFPNEEYTAAAVNGIQSEEGEGGSDDGRSYFSDDVVFGATQQLGWWVWP